MEECEKFGKGIMQNVNSFCDFVRHKKVFRCVCCAWKQQPTAATTAGDHVQFHLLLLGQQ